MKLEHSVMLMLFVLNIIITLVYFLYFYHKKDGKKGYIMKSVIMLLCPVVGPAFFFFSHVVYLVFYKLKADLSDVVFSKERVATHVHADEEQGRNIVPLEEAIAVSDTGNLRNVVMNVVRGDIQKSLSAIALALNSEDSETSHYAASVLQSELNTFRVNVQKLYSKIKDDENKDGSEETPKSGERADIKKNSSRAETQPKEDSMEVRISSAQILVDYMNRVLVQRIFSDLEQENYVRMMSEVGDFLYFGNKNRMTSDMYEAICLRLLEINDYEECEKWCVRAFDEFPDTLASFTCMLKLYFTSGKKDKFFDVLSRLKQSDIVIDKETLELIRAFE